MRPRSSAANRDRRLRPERLVRQRFLVRGRELDRGDVLGENFALRVSSTATPARNLGRLLVAHGDRVEQIPRHARRRHLDRARPGLRIVERHRGDDVGLELWWDGDESLVRAVRQALRHELRDHPLTGNRFLENALDLVIARTTGVVRREGAFLENRSLAFERNAGTDVRGKPATDPLLAGVDRALRAARSTTRASKRSRRETGLGRRRARVDAAQAAGQARDVRVEAQQQQGLDTIVMGPFGPWDFRARGATGGEPGVCSPTSVGRAVVRVADDRRPRSISRGGARSCASRARARSAARGPTRGAATPHDARGRRRRSLRARREATLDLAQAGKCACNDLGRRRARDDRRKTVLETGRARTDARFRRRQFAAGSTSSRSSTSRSTAHTHCRSR